jgi:hypothetical protein
VTRIGFTYNKYQQDRPMQQRVRYVLVEAQIQPKLLGGRVGAGDLSEQKSADLEIERGLRMRLAPQGSPGRAISKSTTWSRAAGAGDRLDSDHHLYSERAVDGDDGRQCGNRHLSRVCTTSTSRRRSPISTACWSRPTRRSTRSTPRMISQRADRFLAKMETTLDDLKTKHLSDQGVALIAELRATTAELRKTVGNPAFQKLPDDTAAAVARVRAILDDPNVTASLTHLSQTLTPDRPDLQWRRSESRRHFREFAPDHRQPARSHGRQQTLPRQLIFGEPPKPPERVR